MVGVEEDYYCGRGRSVGVFFGGADFFFFWTFVMWRLLFWGRGVLEYVRSAWDSCGGIL